jgi:signal transduction histidine kinase
MNVFHAILPLFSSLIFIGVGLAVYFLGRGETSKSFMRFCYFTFHWQFCWFWLFFLNNPNYATLIVKIGYSGIIFLPISFYESVCDYLNVKSKSLKYMYGFGVLFLISLWTTNLFIKGYHTYYFGYYPEANMLHVLYMCLVVYAVSNMIIKLGKIYFYEKNPILKNQVKYMFVALLVYCPASVDYMLNYPGILDRLHIMLYPVGVFFIIGSLLLFVLAHFITMNARLTALNLSLERKVEEKTGQLKKSYEELKVSEEAKKEFIANIAHDIKTPLSVILGHTELLESDVVPGTNVWKCSNFIHRSTMQLNHLIDKLISISILDSEDKLKLECYDYVPFMKNLFHLFQSNAQKQEINYTLSSVDARIVVQVDAAWLERVFGNLIQNAFKFTKPGDNISVKIYRDTEYVYTEVSDTGVGIPADKIKHIFERKYQAHDEQKPQGYGLGLSIVKETLLRFDGKIEVISKEGAGTTFRYQLPLYVDQNAKVKNEIFEGENRRASDRRAANERRTGVERREQERLRQLKDGVEKLIQVEAFKINLEDYENKNPAKPTLLIVDDTPGQINIVIEGLMSDYNLVFAQNGKEGLEKLELYKDTVSLILSDIKMPVMDGIEFCKRVFMNESYSHMPFLFITAYANSEQEFQGLKIGATDYILKPINTYILKEKINHWIIRRQNEIIMQNICKTLEHKTKEISKLKAIIEHEVGHPLSLLTGTEYYFQKLYDKYYSHAKPEVKEMWNGTKSLKPAIESIKSVLDISRRLENTELGRVQSENIITMLQDAVFQSSYLLKPGNVEVNYSVPDESWSVLCDRGLILQVFKNLLRNAAESMAGRPAGFDKKIGLKVEPGENGHVHILISDNGLGMSDETQRKLFQFKFTTKKSGTGIGLYLSMIVIKLHGGFIDVKSKEGKGTTFLLALPLSAEKGPGSK